MVALPAAPERVEVDAAERALELGELEAEVEVERQAQHRRHRRLLEQHLRHLRSRSWTDSARLERLSPLRGANGILMPRRRTVLRQAPSPFMTNFANWKVQKQRTESVIVPL